MEVCIRVRGGVLSSYHGFIPAIRSPRTTVIENKFANRGINRRPAFHRRHAPRTNRNQQF